MARTTARAPRQPRQSKRRPQRRRETRIAFEAIAIEGALLQAELIARIAQEPETPQRGAEYGRDPSEKLREVVQSKFALAQSLQARFLASDRGRSRWRASSPGCSRRCWNSTTSLKLRRS